MCRGWPGISAGRCGGQAAGQGRALPGQAQVCSQAAGEPELRVAGFTDFGTVEVASDLVFSRGVHVRDVA